MGRYSFDVRLSHPHFSRRLYLGALASTAVSALVEKMMPSVLWEQKLPRPRERLLVPVPASTSWSDNPYDCEAGLRGARAHRQRPVTLAVWKRSYSTSSSMYPSRSAATTSFRLS